MRHPRKGMPRTFVVQFRRRRLGIRNPGHHSLLHNKKSIGRECSLLAVSVLVGDFITLSNHLRIPLGQIPRSFSGSFLRRNPCFLGMQICRSKLQTSVFNLQTPIHTADFMLEVYTRLLLKNLCRMCLSIRTSGRHLLSMPKHGLKMRHLCSITTPLP